MSENYLRGTYTPDSCVELAPPSLYNREQDRGERLFAVIFKALIEQEPNWREPQVFECLLTVAIAASNRANEELRR